MSQASYWQRHLREPVLFSDSIATLLRQGYKTFVEIGPKPVLTGIARTFSHENDTVWLPSLNEGTDDWVQMLESLSTLYAMGFEVDWHGFDRGRIRNRLPLPTYPFRRGRYWLDRHQALDSRPVADPSAVWRFAVDSGRRRADQGPLSLDVKSYPEKWRLLERLTVAYITRTLVLLGVFTKPNERYSTDEILEKFSVLLTYRKLLNRWLKRLTGTGQLHSDGESFTNSKPLEMPSLDMLLDEARRAFTDAAYLVDYIERCGELLKDILTARQDPLETLFPGGSSQTTEWLYGDWVVSRQISGIAASIVSSIVSSNPGAAPCRILEIGAGTGGTTGAVIGALPPLPVEYWFTDVSEFFFGRATEKYKDYPFIHYRLFDVEKKPIEQGLPAGVFEVVLATNVLHATLNLEATLDNVLALLAPGGIFILSEVTEDFAWLDISTALIEGWQKFEDKWRKENPLLSPRQWDEVLRSRGFQDVEIIPEAGSAGEVLGQHVVIARAPVCGRVIDSANIAAPLLVPSTVRPDDSGHRVVGQPPDFSDEFQQRLMKAPSEERRELLVNCVRNQLAVVLRSPPDHLPNRSGRLMDLGVDSLMAVELRNRLAVAMGLKRKLPATLVFDYPTAEAIAGYLDREFFDIRGRVEPEPGQISETIERKKMTAEAIAGMSDEQVESMLLERLQKKRGTRNE